MFNFLTLINFVGPKWKLVFFGNCFEINKGFYLNQLNSLHITTSIFLYCISAFRLDFLLDSGLYTGEVTEIAGVSGCGKTQVRTMSFLIFLIYVIPHRDTVTNFLPTLLSITPPFFFFSSYNLLSFCSSPGILPIEAELFCRAALSFDGFVR